MQSGKIRLLTRAEIDVDQWNEIIEQSPDSRLYATAWYLDTMAEGWQALVYDDYEFVMPLPVRKKAGIKYVFQPNFCQQLGVFGKSKITQSIQDFFLTELQRHFKYAEINCHSGQLESTYKYVKRKNYLLNLNAPVEVIRKSISRSALRNIEKANKRAITIHESADAKDLIDLYKKRFGYKNATKADLQAVEKLLKHAIEQGFGYCYGAKNREGDTIATSGYILFNNRLTFLINGNLQEGLDAGATHLLKNYAIETFAGQNLWMDFEGSDNPQFARFYEQYGAKAIDDYPYFIFNNLPGMIKWIKPSQP